MNYQSILKLQSEYDVKGLQDGINDGSVWKFEGSMGRRAMEALDSGECMLPKKFTFDYYGNKLPSRDVLQKGTKGTYQNSINYWTRLLNGEFFDEEFDED